MKSLGQRTATSSCCGATTQTSHAPHEQQTHGHDHHAHDHASVATQLGRISGARRSRLQIQAMDCPTEARLIEQALSGMPGVASLHFDFFQRVLTVEHALPSLEGVLAAIARVGMQAREMDGRVGAPEALRRRGALWLFRLSAVAAVAAEGISWLGGAGKSATAVMLLACLSILCGGLPTLKKGWIALKARQMNIHFLMTVAVGGALAIGQWPEAAMVLFLFGVAERLESMSLARAGAAVRALMALAPDSAWVAQADGAWRQRPVSEVMPGARVRVRPGERVPLDGVIVAGNSSFDEAPITGESLPCDKSPGQTVFAGAINGAGLVEVRVSAASDGSLLARIIDSVRDAQGARAPTQRFIDRFARYYTPLVVALALLLALVLPWLGLMTPKAAIYQSLVLLVIACPCALVIATPVTLVSALSAAARQGILIKGGAALETAARVRAVAFDKTGTLTTGRMTLTGIEACAELDADALLALASSLDAHSTHPLARALLAAARRRSLPLMAVADLREQAGVGVHGTINGVALALGSRRLLDAATASDPVRRNLERFEAQGQAVLLLLRGVQLLGIFAVADRPRAEAYTTLARLAQDRIHCVMLSGDNPRAVHSVAQASGIAEAHAGLLPHEKRAHIERLQLSHGTVAMVGDGVNDAPALARADLGIAMGAGSDSALETAAVALMDNHLGKLPAMLAHARRSMRVLKFNLGLALAIKLLFFTLALCGLASLWMALFADVGASLLVVGNGLRLARARCL